MPFSHGNFASIPRVTGSPSDAAEIERPVSVRHHLGGIPLQAIALAKHRFGLVGRHHPRGGGIGRIGEGDEHRDHAPFTGTTPVSRLISLNDTRLPAGRRVGAQAT